MSLTTRTFASNGIRDCDLPAWLLAAVDWWQSRLLATTIAGAALGYAAALCIGFPFIDPFAVMMAGLVAALPAAVSFWLSKYERG
ncbi:uncharacterized membrane protein YoaK (UPF0700 family) [Bradyrhizobium sp. i1.4.4]|uniref:hypothetical protein n=1 Tax=Bradyrhizobium TaxID=374 RepID=UPI00117F36A5|nr:hypothetical protein [Bradyrhizobium japonicum]